MKRKLLLISFVLFSTMTFGQENNDIITTYLTENKERLQLERTDIQDWIVTNEVYSKKSQITHIYIQQTHQGIPIFNAVANLAIKEGKVIHSGFSFVKTSSSKVTSKTPSLDAKTAIERAASQLKINKSKSVTLIDKKTNNHFIYDGSGISSEKIPVELVYQPIENGSLKLSWKLNIHQLDGEHWWNIRVDANSGTILEKNDWEVHCNFNHTVVKRDDTSSKKHKQTQLERESNSISEGNYHVFPIPVESPNHGSSSLVSNAVNRIASPFGWHDDNGAAGAEYTITRGNNVYAQFDSDGSNSTFGYSPDGGDNLDFNFQINITNTTPGVYLDASITHLFYANNVIHDVLYQYGFDEVSGNFQANNYGKGGLADDFVIADAQDVSRVNNATFATPPDGYNPRMQMFLWNFGGGIFNVNNTTLKGSYRGSNAFFVESSDPFANQTGVLIRRDFTVTSNLVLIDDGSSDPTKACNASAILPDLTGKIVVIRKGNCEVVDKVKLVQSFGAAAVVLVNIEADFFFVSEVSTEIQIPVVSIEHMLGESIISELENNKIVNVTLADYSRDSGFDNGVIAHEFGHGVSNRLIGGPSNTDCMFNAEQLGEGWSDFFAAMFATTENIINENSKSIATFPFGQTIDEVGIRQYTYSTDMTVNPFTFDSVKDQAFEDSQIGSVHAVGSIWATFLWDLNSSMVASYGFDSDFHNGTGGNNKTMELVIEGLKLTPCNSGFVGARDAILAADEAINGGVNQCLIWQVFARRGLGYSASSGETDSIIDQEVAFDMPPNSMLPCSQNVSDFTVYPNPSNGNMTIAGLNNIEDAMISVFDLKGRIVFSEKRSLFGVTKMEMTNLRTGIYIMQITTSTSNYKQKIIIE